jgi:hypothetical protein
MAANEVAAAAKAMGLTAVVLRDKRTGIEFVEVKKGHVMIGEEQFSPTFTFGGAGLLSLTLIGPGACGAEKSSGLVKRYMSLVAEKYPQVVASTNGFVGDPSSGSRMFTRYSDSAVHVDVGLDAELNRYCESSMHSEVFLRYMAAEDSQRELQRGKDQREKAKQEAIDDL